ncbi:hypothetical protein AB9L18_09330 [Stenotrophomonas lactitubi]|uniref:hypothetical protein n=1 Tax=Stenotrophomonas lactitubi TaxID=2045214 RepID=UPI0035BFCF1D
MTSAITPLPPETLPPLVTVTVVLSTSPAPLNTIPEPVRPRTLELSMVIVLSAIELPGVPGLEVPMKIPFSSPATAEPLAIRIVELDVTRMPVFRPAGSRFPVPSPVDSTRVPESSSTPLWM